MNLTSKNTLSCMLNSFKSDSEEEGELLTTQESDPKNFRADKQLTPYQLSKFLEYYTEKSSGEYKYTKTQLNKINTIVHNHFHFISKDVKIFKLYKSLVQLVTQDMHEWIDKDYYCGDVILEILREVQSRKDNPWYGKIYKRLRLEEIVSKQIEKAEVRRRKAEDDRIMSKRARNWEKKQKKVKVLVDPFESIQLPSKLPEAVKENEEVVEEEIFKRPCFEDICEEVEPEVSANQEADQDFDLHEIENWFECSLNETRVVANGTLPDKRLNPSSLDPRIEVHLKCRGLNFILENPTLSNKLEKFRIIINLKCLVYILDRTQISSLRGQIPKETIQISYKNQEFLICFRPHARDFLNSCQKFAEISLFSLVPDDLATKIFPNFKVITTKCIEINDELTIILDNEKIGWKQNLLVPVLYYDPFLIEEKLMICTKICNLRDKEMVEFCVREGEQQLDGVEKMIYTVFTNFIENRFLSTAICEFRNALKAVFAGISFSVGRYKERIGGAKGYNLQKLEVYCVAAEDLGGEVKEGGKYSLVENRSEESEVSGKWIIACFLNFRFLEKF